MYSLSMYKFIISLNVLLCLMFGAPFGVFATQDLSTIPKQPVKKVVQKAQSTQIKKTTPPKKQVKTPPKKKTPSKPVQVKKTSQTPQKKTSSVIKVPKKELSGEILDVTINQGDVLKKNEVLPAQQKDTSSLIAKQSFLQERIDLSQFLKTQADALMAKIQQDPNASDYLDTLRKQNGIPELQDQFKKLQDQVNGLEKDIQTASSGGTSIDLSKTLSLQKTKFPLIQQQESILQQIELKENFTKQLYDSTKREYDFNSKLYNSLAQKYTSEQTAIQKLKNEIDALQKGETQPTQASQKSTKVS